MPTIHVVLAREYDATGTDLGEASTARLDAALNCAGEGDWFVFGAGAPPRAEPGCPTLAFLQARYVRSKGRSAYIPLNPRLGWGTYAELQAALLTALKLAVQSGEVEGIVFHTSGDHLPRVRRCVLVLLKRDGSLGPLHDAVLRFEASAPDLTWLGKVRECIAIVALYLGITTTPQAGFIEVLGEYETNRMRSGRAPSLPRE